MIVDTTIFQHIKKTAVGLIATALILTLSGCGGPESLNPPELFKVSEKNNGALSVKGISYPKAEVLIYIDDVLTQTGTSDGNGNFDIPITLSTEKEYSLKTKQKYKEVQSDFSENINFSVDTTPPNNEINIYTNIPSTTNQDSLELSGKIIDGSKVLINNEETSLNGSKEFSKKISLKEGDNKIQIKIADEVGNLTDIVFEKSIYKDTKAPKYSSYTFSCTNNNNLFSTEEMVCLQTSRFTGPLYGTAYAPFTGKVIGKIKSIKVNKTYLKWNEAGQINQNVALYVRVGTNNYDIEIIDEAGNKTTDIYSVSWEDEYTSQQDDLQDRIDDLESRLDDIE